MPRQRIVTDLKDEMMIYEPEADLVHFLNPTARRIFQLYHQGMDSSAIEDALRKEFDVPEGCDLQADIRQCMEELLEKDLLRGPKEG